MTALFCALISGICFYFSFALGAQWWLAWLAPIPVLWLAFGKTNWRIAGLACWAAVALGTLNLLPAYAGELPVVVLVVPIVLLGLSFAALALGARFVARRISPLAGVLAFAALWTGSDFLMSLGNNGTAVSPAYSQVGAPLLIQGASVFGLWIVTFLLGFVAAGMAMSFATRRASPAAAAILVFAANAVFGFARMTYAAPTGTVRIGLGANDSVIRTAMHPDTASAEAVIDTYARAAHELASGKPALIVFPEKVAILMAAWRDATIARLCRIARETNATMVIGFDDRGPQRLNDALIFPPDGTAPELYAKRHMVPVLESAFTIGQTSFMLPDHTGVAICKDLDFQATIRGAAALHPTLMAVPAWDFNGDRWWHARLAILRGVENGFAVARAANDGLLTLSDAYGRVLLRKPSALTGMVTAVGDLSRGPGDTIYRRIGDVFAWAALALAALLLGLAFARRRSPDMRPR